MRSPIFVVTPINWKQENGLGVHLPLLQSRQSLVSPIDWKLPRRFVKTVKSSIDANLW